MSSKEENNSILAIARVTFTAQAGCEAKAVEVVFGTTLLEAARSAKVQIEAPCNAIGTCGKCRVLIPSEPQRDALVSAGKHHLDAAQIEQGYVLACQAKVHGDVDVLVSDDTDRNRSLRILTGGDSFSYAVAPAITKRTGGGQTEVFAGNRLLGVEEGDTSSEIFGIALDIGTTTMVAELVDLVSGEILSSSSVLNPQTAFAQDVLTRIHFAGEDDGLSVLYAAFLQAFGQLRDELCEAHGVDPSRIYEVVYSGNTAMLHMATATDPTSLGRYPYTPIIRGAASIAASALGIAACAQIYLPPIISSFVGADITSGILSTQLAKRDATTLFIDVGTNGEIVLSHNGELTATSTAAGPAFEGMNITYGMRAAAGAIEEFVISDDGSFDFKTIGDAAAVGICGSGLLDVVGELVRTGVVQSTGRFVKAEQLALLPPALQAALRPSEGKLAFYLTDAICLTQRDLRQVQLAKGAIRSGITALLNHQGIASAEVDEVLIAGSFGYHLRESSLLAIGMLPPELAGRVSFVGNTSQSGAAALLLNKHLRDELEALAASVHPVELADTDDFDRLFIASLGF